MNKKGFAISVVLYTMVILVIGIFYLLLGIVRHRYTVGNDLKETVINGITPGEPPISRVLADIVEDTLTMTDADSDGTRYIITSNPNNYVWYSGKLWRIISVNSDRSVKIVTHNSVSSVSWDKTNSNTDYSTSLVREWLNDEFVETLANIDNVLMDSKWDYTTYPSFPTTKLATTKYVTEKVGLLNIYEYMMTGGKESGRTNCFLATDNVWWTMSPQSSGSAVWSVSGGRFVYALNDIPTDAYGIRPAVNFRIGIKVTGGNGTVTNPYTIEGDKDTGKKSELLNNRISGEYINFNNTSYRIVGTETINGKKLTKVTMVDYDVNLNTLTPSLAFGADASQRIYSREYGIGLYLEEWYQADSTSETYASIYITETYKNMIATAEDYGIVWYTGPVSPEYPSIYNYKQSINTNPVSATIGMGAYGEMFSTQFSNGPLSAEVTWLITIFTSSQLWIVNASSYARYDAVYNTNGVRPSFYLKEGVEIIGGSGMPHDPYEITM